MSRPSRARTLGFFGCLFLGGILAALPFSSWIGARDGGLLCDLLVRLSGLGALMFLFFPWKGIDSRGRIHPLSWLALALSFAVAVNNFPIVGALSGAAALPSQLHSILLFLLLCAATATLEELLFRGLLLRLLLLRLSHRRGGRIMAALLSGGTFGLFHLSGLAAGQSLPTTLLQVSYTALIGTLCACLCLLFGSILPAIIFHTIYNFGGLLYHTLGTPPPVTQETVVFTAALAGVTGASLLLAMWQDEKEQP